MNLEKAIEILTKMEKTLEPTMAISGIEAMELGIEAMKDTLRDRRGLSDCEIELLPGETEE